MALPHRWVRSDTSVGSGQRLAPVALDVDGGYRDKNVIVPWSEGVMRDQNALEPIPW